MNAASITGKAPSLKKVLGFTSLFVVAVGNVTTQSSFVSILNGVGEGGATFFIAIFLAAVLTLCYVFTFLELSLMMPKAGGPGTFTTVAIGHFPAIILVLCGYVISAAFTIPSELILLKRVFDEIFPGTYAHIDLMILALFTLLNVLGINIFSSTQNLIVFVMIITVLVIGFAGLGGSSPQGIDPAAYWHQIVNTDGSVFSLMLLALWSFAGLEFVCPLIEESKNPEKNLPKALLYGLVALIIIYGLMAFAGLRQLPSTELAGSEIPHWLLVKSLFGNAAKIIILIFVITACSSTANIIVATTPRLLYGMAHHKQLPAFFKQLHPRWNTPWLGILFFSCLSAIPLIVWGSEPGFILVMIISAATVWLIAYIISHINLIILRKRYPLFKRPFKTPLYPLPQLVGIIGMSYALWNNSPSAETASKVYITSGIFAGVAFVYAFFWVKFKMKRGLFEAEPIEQAILD